MDGSVSRRRLLGGTLAVTAALSGCLEQPPRRTSRAVLVTNATDAAFTVTVRLYDLPEDTASGSPTPAAGTETGGGADVTADGGTPTASEPHPPTDDLEQVLVRRKDLPPGESYGIPAEELPAGALRGRVTTTDGQSDRYDWTRIDERSTLDVRIVADAVRFTEID